MNATLEVETASPTAAATVELSDAVTPIATHPALPAGLRRIVLTGFMGAGKTTAGKKLAAELGWVFKDLDVYLEERTGTTIADLFLRNGEDGFRRMESAALASALGKKNVVIALGGGTPELLTNRLLLEQTPATLTIFLDAPFDVLIERCRNQKDASVRPLLARLPEAEDRYHQRLPHYRRIARITVETSALDAEHTVSSLLDSLTLQNTSTKE